MNDQDSRKTRRAALQAAGLAVLAPLGVTATGVTRARAQDKLAPEMVMYQATPKDGQKCSTCLHWQPPNACAIISGNISPEAWCAVWAAKPA